ncbi:DUF4160 domain-containing protein [Enterobacteriales bacterium SAP-6]|uniref:DUF4160 domain-containing protein n=2 Tax=Acerihabitans arboris TaxID=2691583 RepID=A0A845SKX3_9GAMM|nr:DUF4160 domain-containing protein [Acerihabitans arboris]
MPTIFRFKGWRVMIYTMDHLPPHVHVIGTNGQVVFVLLKDNIELREMIGVKSKELAEIEKELLKQLPQLQSAWEQIHGN